MALRDPNFRPELRLENVNSRGVGSFPSIVAEDYRLTLESKAIYGMLSILNETAESLTLEIILRRFNVSTDRFRKHVALLAKYGYITIEKERKDNPVSKNVYKFNTEVYVPERLPDKPDAEEREFEESKNHVCNIFW